MFRGDRNADSVLNKPVFRMRAPLYRSYQDEQAANPIRVIPEIRLPGLKCPVCHQEWMGDRRLYLPIRNEALRKKLNKRGYLPERSWRELESLVRADTGLPEDTVLKP